MKRIICQQWQHLTVLLVFTLLSHVSLADSVAKDQWSRSTVVGVLGSKEVIVKIIGLSADADLYVRKAQQPSLAEFDCRPALRAVNDEACIIALSNGETAHIGVFGAEAAQFFIETNFVDAPQANSNTSLFVETSSIDIQGGTSNTPQPLVLGRIIPEFVQSNQFKYYVFDSATLPALTDEYLVPSTQNFDGFGIEFVAHATNLNADADLYIEIGALPTIQSNRCASTQANTESEQCAVFLKDLNGQPVYVGVNGANTSASYNLQALIQKTINVSPDNIPVVNNGFSTTAKVLKGQWNYYQINPSLVSTASSISVTMTPTNNDVDLYMRTQAPPIALHWDCFANKSGTTVENCTKNNPAPDQSFYFGVFGFTTSNYSVSVSIQQ